MLDEFPWLCLNDPGLEGMLQAAWDRELEKRPALLLLIGSDLTMMERLTAHDRPLFGRAREMTIGGLSPAAVTDLQGLDPARGLDAYLVTGGYPRMLADWEPGSSLADFLRAELQDTASTLVVAGQRIVDAEFPAEAQAGTVLRTIGSGESVYTRLQQRAGVSAAPLSRALSALVDAKRVVARDVPLSTAASKEARYRIGDPYLRFGGQGGADPSGGR